ncbi:kinase-like domain-containing protein [Glomus cerebriforme]|uniref:Kinase-like domain-containing protein n=1 Tax=Glomus cerebriforme TaxID=658196 RepID=A0A397TIG7_9GLOM|nr:kinase-like domain-containing protein [Glomus cerebriforme]
MLCNNLASLRHSIHPINNSTSLTAAPRRIISEIDTGGSASVHIAYLENTTIPLVIKKFFNSSNEEIINEIKIMGMVSHPNIIRFYGVTKFKDEVDYSLVLEYADSGTLEKYLCDNAETFKWENQLKFAKEISGAISWLHNKTIVHGDLHSKNILIHQQQPHQHTIKLADFGRSFLQGRTKVFTKACGVIPYMDPKIFQTTGSRLYYLNKKSDIYGLGVLLWQLTSYSSPFDFAKIKDDYFELYQKCWQHEPDKRPDIYQVISELKSIDSIDPENDNSSNNFNPKESETTEELDNEYFYSPSCDDLNINSDKYQI